MSNYSLAQFDRPGTNASGKGDLRLPDTTVASLLTRISDIGDQLNGEENVSMRLLILNMPFYIAKLDGEFASLNYLESLTLMCAEFARTQSYGSLFRFPGLSITPPSAADLHGQLDEYKRKLLNWCREWQWLEKALIRFEGLKRQYDQFFNKYILSKQVVLEEQERHHILLLCESSLFTCAVISNNHFQRLRVHQDAQAEYSELQFCIAFEKAREVTTVSIKCNETLAQNHSKGTKLFSTLRHYYEGKKPSVVDYSRQLLYRPLKDILLKLLWTSAEPGQRLRKKFAHVLRFFRSIVPTTPYFNLWGFDTYVAKTIRKRFIPVSQVIKSNSYKILDNARFQEIIEKYVYPVGDKLPPPNPLKLVPEVQPNAPAYL